MELIVANITKNVFWDFGDTLVGLKPDILHEFTEMIFQNCGRKIRVTDLKELQVLYEGLDSRELCFFCGFCL